MLTVLTPTGARPEAFSQCVRWMAAQTYSGSVRWVIVDDGPEALPVPAIPGWEILTVRPMPFWRSGENTQARNILEGLDHVTDRVAIVEDDDEYAPWWLERCAERLDGAEVIGESHSLYRHLNGAERRMENAGHASLCSTAVRGAGIERLRQAAITRPRFIDLELWKGGGKLYPPEPRGVTGIKGFPGRPGIGIGHKLR